jgi:hypothetical protein
LGLVAKSVPLVRVSLVFAGEIWAIWARDSTGATCWEIDDCRVPITPAMSGSEDSLLAALAPVSGLPASS